MAQPKTKRKGKPKWLVKPEKTTREAQKIIDSNAAQSPFLRVSPEIRNRIYALVFGGNGIHIFLDRFGHMAHSICMVATSVHHASGAHDTEDAAEQDPPNHRKHHETCKWDRSHWDRGKVVLDLTLLRASKQIHQEAALLPFTLNTFMTVDLHDLGHFATKLLMAQKLAVASLSVHLLLGMSGPTNKERNGIKKLRGLRCLHYTLELQECFSLPSALEVSETLNTVPGLFDVPSLMTAKVRVRAFGRFRDQSEMSLPASYHQRTREIEEALLKRSVQRGQEELQENRTEK